jgi:hypothetical protein
MERYSVFTALPIPFLVCILTHIFFATSEIMGMDVTKQMKQTKGDHGQELKKFDKHVIRTLDKEIRTAQEALSKIGVPTMSCTDDPTMIASQIKVLRLLEDLLHT